MISVGDEGGAGEEAEEARIRPGGIGKMVACWWRPRRTSVVVLGVLDTGFGELWGWLVLRRYRQEDLVQSRAEGFCSFLFSWCGRRRGRVVGDCLSCLSRAIFPDLTFLFEGMVCWIGHGC